jgi:hypothetical protein
VTALDAALSSPASVAPIADFNEKTFVTHAGEVTPGNSNVGQIFRSDLTPLSREGDRALPQRGFRAAGQPNSLSAVAITLPHPNGRLWRSSFEGNQQHIVRIFIRPGEPLSIEQTEAVAEEMFLNPALWAFKGAGCPASLPVFAQFGRIDERSLAQRSRGRFASSIVPVKT